MRSGLHLNPKIGLDWMARGQQKEVVTPGQNQKRYLAGALDGNSWPISGCWAISASGSGAWPRSKPFVTHPEGVIQ
jgi:hypothetical protein